MKELKELKELKKSEELKELKKSEGLKELKKSEGLKELKELKKSEESMNLLPYEILERIMLGIPPNNLADLCCVDENFAAIGRDQIFRLRYSDWWLLEIRSYYPANNGLFLAGLIDSTSLIEYFLNKGGSIEQLIAGAASTKNYRLVDYSIQLLEEKKEYREEYLEYQAKIRNVLTYYGYLYYDQELLKRIYSEETSLEDQILAYAYNGNIDALLILIQRYQPLDVIFFYKIIEELVKRSHLECIEILAEKYDSFGIYIYQNAIGYATKYGNIDLVETLLERENFNLYLPILEAAYKGDYYLLDLFLEKGITQGTSDLRDKYIIYAFSSVFKTILIESKIKFVDENAKIRKFIKEKIENKYRMIDYLIEIGNINLNEYMIDAIRDDNIQMLEHCITKGADQIMEAFYFGFYHNKLNIIKYLSKIYSNQFLNQNSEILKEGLLIASKYGYIEMINFLISLGATNIEECFNNCAYHGRRSTMIYLMDHFSVNLNEGLINATIGNQKEIAQLLISQGATNLEEASLHAVRLNLFPLLVLFYSYLIHLESFDLLIHLALASNHERLEMIRHMMIHGGKNKLSVDQIDNLIEISKNQNIRDYLNHIKLCQISNI